MDKVLTVTVRVTARGDRLAEVDSRELQLAAEQAVYHCLGRAGDAGLGVYDDSETLDTTFHNATVAAADA